MKVLLKVYLPLLASTLAVRLFRLSTPSYLAFDERYYVIQAYALKTYGHEQDLRLPYSAFPSATFTELNPYINAFSHGERDVFGGPYFTPHPPLGKWLLALGQLFGDSSFYWRLPSVLAGTLTVLLFASLLLTLFKSRSLALVGGLLLGVADTLTLVVNRLGILDNFIALFVMLAVWLLVKTWRSTFTWRLYPVTLLLGLAVSVKWSGLYYLLALMGLVGVLHLQEYLKTRQVLLGLKLLYRELLVLLIAALTYVASWTGWFATQDGWFRHWSERYPDDPFLRFLPHTLRSWCLYQSEIYNFHKTFDANDGSVAPVYSWFTTYWPMNITTQEGASGVQQLSLYANPVIMLSLLPLLVATVVVYRRQLKKLSPLLLPLVLLGVGYLPWLVTARVAFPFYQPLWLPWVILTLLTCWRLLKARVPARGRRWELGLRSAWLVAAFSFLLVWSPFVYFLKLSYLQLGVYQVLFFH